jgi:hypothetical protein
MRLTLQETKEKLRLLAGHRLPRTAHLNEPINPLQRMILRTFRFQ